MTGCPGGLEIETARDTVDVHDLPGKIEPRGAAALHRLKINLFERDTSRCHELVLIQALPLDLETTRGQFDRKTVTGLNGTALRALFDENLT